MDVEQVCNFDEKKPLFFHSGPENLEKSRQKKLVKSNKSDFFHEIAFLAVLNFFPVQKMIFAIFEIAKKGI